MKNCFPYLMYAGVIPFVFCAICLGFGIRGLLLFGSTERVLSVYGLVISSFLAGAHWGQHLKIGKVCWSFYLAILSNIIAVSLWLCFLIVSFKVLMIIFVALFSILLIIDHRLVLMGFIPADYFKKRFVVSVLVIISLIFSGIVS